MNRLVSTQPNSSSSSGSTWGSKLIHVVSRFVAVGGTTATSAEPPHPTIPTASRYSSGADKMGNNIFGPRVVTSTTNNYADFDRYRDPKLHNECTNDGDDSDASNDDGSSSTTKCRSYGEISSDEDETFCSPVSTSVIIDLLPEERADSVPVPGTSSGTGMVVKIKQEKNDEEDDHDGDVVDVDKHNVPVHMIRVPLQEWNEMVKAKQELETLKGEENVHDQPANQDRETEQFPVVNLVTPNKETNDSRPGGSQNNQPTANVEPVNSRRGRPRKIAVAPDTKSDNSRRSRHRKNQVTVNEVKSRPGRSRRSQTALDSNSTTPDNVTLQGRRFECSTCSKTFATRRSLKTHELSHSRPTEGEFSCGFCDRKNFKTAHHLRQHEARHNPHVPCEFCGKLFGSLPFMRAHQRSNKRCIEERGIQRAHPTV